MWKQMRTTIIETISYGSQTQVSCFWLIESFNIIEHKNNDKKWI